MSLQYSSYYNQGSGLTDVDADIISTSLLIGDSGFVYLDGNSLSNVGTIDGVSVPAAWDKTVWTSNNLIGPFDDSDIQTDIYRLNQQWVSLSNDLHNVDLRTSSNTTDITTLENDLSTVELSLDIVADVCASNDLFIDNYFYEGGSNALGVRSSNIIFFGSNLFAKGGASNNKIDAKKWLFNVPSKDENGVLDYAETIIKGAQLATDVGELMMDAQGAIQGPLRDSVLQEAGQALGEEALDEAFEGDEDSIEIHNNQIIFPIVHKNKGDSNVAFPGNVMLHNSAKLSVVPKTDLTIVDSGRYKRISSLVTSTTIIDLETRTLMNLSNISCCNISACNGLFSNCTFSNLRASNAFMSNVTFCNAIASKVKVGNYVVLPQGIFLYDPITDPMTSQLIIDASGRYVGSIDMSQVVGLESLNFNKLSDGITSYQSTGSTSTNAFDSLVNSSSFELNL
jgi:hypothetical protein